MLLGYDYIADMIYNANILILKPSYSSSSDRDIKYNARHIIVTYWI